MACLTTLNGIARDCAHNIGGIKKIWIAPYQEGVATLAQSGDQKISGLAEGAAAKFAAYWFARNTASMTSTLNKDNNSGTSYVSTELVMQFNKMEASKRLEIEALSTGDVMVIAQDNNGTAWFLGFDAPVEASAGTGQTGAAKADGNFYNITLSDESFGYPYEVSDDIVKTLPEVAVK